MSIKFLTIEGGEGTGKTTIINMLSSDLEKMNIKVLKTREPGGSKIAEEIRNVILDVKNTNMDYMTEALLYAASRKQHLEEIVKPAINDGKLVISDRYIDSSLAYQGKARGLGIKTIYDINMYATNGFLPDLTLLIDLPPEVGLERISSNNRDVNRLDLEVLDFHNLVREGYLEIAKRFPNRIKVIDGNRSIEEVYKDVLSIVLDKIRN